MDRLTLSPEGVVWMAVEEGGLYYWENDTWMRVNLDGYPEGAGITDLDFTADGVLWLTTTNGAGRFDGESWQWFNTGDGLGYHALTALATGPSNTLWFGGWRGGLTRFGPPLPAGD